MATRPRMVQQHRGRKNDPEAIAVNPASHLCLALFCLLLAATAGAQSPDQQWSPGSDATSESPLLAFLSVQGPAADELSIRSQLARTDAAGHYQLQVTLENNGDEAITAIREWSLRLGPGLDETPIEGLGIAENLYSFVEPFVYQHGGLLRFREGDEEGGRQWRSLEESPDWFGLQSRYHTLLVDPRDGATGTLRYRTASNGDSALPARYLPEMELVLLPNESASGAAVLEPGASETWDFHVYAGPKTREALAADADYRELLFPGLWQWMRWLAFGLLALLGAIHSLVPSWGLAIVLLAVLVRLLMYPVARRALKSQAAFVDVQKRIQPELQRIKREYKGGEQSERILELYEEHQVSPLAGLKPLLIVMIQIPVFVALFHVLGTAYELRDAGFLWMQTLAEPDRLFSFGVELPLLGAYFNLLPFLMAFTTLLTIRLSPAPAADEGARRRQNFIQVLMAIGFLLLFYPFPAGMVLYWTMANVLHLLQQLLVERWGARRATGH